MDDYSSKPAPNWFERLLNRFTHEPEDREELVSQLHAAFERNVLDAEALSMIEGVLSFSERTVREVMVQRSQMDVIRLSEPMEKLLSHVIEAGHSRFPVIGEDKDDVQGILLSKDLLRYFLTPNDFDLQKTLRPVVFVPESKRLDGLLREFRATKTHMAIVVDEYGGVSGLITIEDVLEVIVGDIDDEHDLIESEDDIVPVRGERYRVLATTSIDDFNDFFECALPDDEVDTIGGLVTANLGYVPVRGEGLQLQDWHFTVIRADSRRLQALLVERRPQAAR
ncbi:MULTISPECIES: HlyC/CorC family transporter [Vogesella]|uniref:Magnesium and cobalt efflux protein CorC n=2 Tax=Vogesella TaxID=57739 RepID=A0ABT5I7H0_VOGIN|nr:MULTISPECIES: transporter associated domain-containing protein [Vogesella]MDC7691840.1 transporter associated domain-containing protein [Vogesella indigofera]MDC7698725.1 transporter associated domain-containing protein [Vogesella indigofera]MDC7705210.1 transporter associated domain-containing protein [Vogesella indigofera]MDC7711636.1 transporter associated domain-containing protein [Vogesella indigofera]GHD80639.1 cation transporter [Vogesella fluminis]